MKKNIYYFIYAVIGSISLLYNGVKLTESFWIDTIFASLNGFSITSLVVVVSLFYFYKKSETLEIENKSFIYLISAFFSMIMSFGKYINYRIVISDSKMIFYFELIMIVILFIGYFVLFKYTLSFVCYKISRIDYRKAKTSKLNYVIFEKKIYFIIIICAFIPYAIAFFPGVISFDGGYQIGQYLGDFLFTDHHTPLISIWYGLFAKLFISSGNYFILFIPVIIQFILYTLFIYELFELFKFANIRYSFRWVSLLYFSIFPVFFVNIMTYLKDSIYFTIFGLIVIYLYKVVVLERKNNIDYILLFIYSFLLSLTRSNGIYIVIVSILFALFFVKKKIWMLIVFVSLVITFSSANNYFYNHGVMKLKFQPNIYNIMFQQTARYGLEHFDEITPEEYEILDSLFEFYKTPFVYNPRVADEVQRTLRGDYWNTGYLVIGDRFNEYFQVWKSQFFKHPLTYISSFFEGSYGFYYPEIREAYEGLGWYKSINPSVSFSYQDLEWNRSLRKGLEVLAYTTRELPVIGLIYSIGLHMWVVFFCALLSIFKKNWKVLTLTIPALLNFGVCIISPISGYIRYALPFFLLTPLYLFTIWNMLRNREEI